MTDWLTLDDAAKHLQISKCTIYVLTREGDRPARTKGR